MYNTKKFVQYVVCGFFGLISATIVAWAGHCISEELSVGINLGSVATSFILFLGGMGGVVGIGASIGAAMEEVDTDR